MPISVACLRIFNLDGSRWMWEGLMRYLKTGFVLAAALLAAVSANAQPHPGGEGGAGGAGGAGAPSGLITSVTAEQLASLFTAAGFQSQVYQNGNTRMVKTVFWTPSVFGGVIPQLCDNNGQCSAFQIFVNLGNANVDQKWIDAWNNKYLYVRAYNVNGNIVFEWNIGLFTGLTPEYIEFAAKIFKKSVDQSTDFKP